MASKPDLLKWVPTDDAAKVIDPGTTKKTNGFLYLEKPAFQYVNYLFNRLSKWLRGLQGSFADVIVGSAAQVTSYDATHTINQLNDTIVAQYSRVLFLQGTHVLTANLSLTNSNLVLEMENSGAIIDLASLYKIGFSGNRIKANLKFSNVTNASDAVSVGGIASQAILHDVDAINVTSSDTSQIQCIGTNCSIKMNGSVIGPEKGADIASASSINIGQVGRFFHITGTTPVSAITARKSGELVSFLFESANTILHNAVSMILPGGVTMNVNAGAVVQFFSEGSGNWRALAPVSEFTTGDVKTTYKSIADPGWVMMNDGSIGNQFSAATTRANSDTLNLFLLLWNNIADAWAPVSGGRGANAQADFDANKRLTLPRALGRSISASGAGSSLTNRALGEYLGVETVALTSSNNGPHTHNVGSSTNTVAFGGGAQGPGSGAIASSSSGSGTPHQNMAPVTYINVEIKL
jgi:hypothetical protein